MISRRALRTLAAAVVLVGGGARVGGEAREVRGVGGVDEEVLRSAEQRQALVRAQAQEVATALAGLLGDFELNGLASTPEAQLLRELQASLSRLTDEEMARVVGLLREARSAPGNLPVAEAHARQQAILEEFRRMLAEYARQQDLFSLGSRLDALVERQRRAMLNTVYLARTTMSPRKEEGGRAALSVMLAEQTTLTADAADALNALAEIARKSPGEEPTRLTEALAMARDLRILDNMRQVATDLGAGKVFQPGDTQRAVRNGLRAVRRAIAPPQTRAQALQAAANELQAEADFQMLIAAESAAAANGMAKGAAKGGANGRGDYVGPERRTIELVDRVDLTRGDLTSLVPAAAETLEGALASMQAARSKLEAGSGDLARAIAADQEAARAALIKAREQVLAELAKEKRENPEGKPAGQEGRLSAEQQLEKLAKSQRDLAEAKQLPRQEQGERQKQLEQEARKLAGEMKDRAGGAEVEKAAEEMSKAAESLKADKPEEAVEAQKRTAEHLDRAQEAARAERQKAQAEAKEKLKQVEQAQKQLDQAIEQQSKASQAASDAAAEKQEQKRQEAARDAAEQQQRAAEAAKAAEEQTKKASPEAGEKLVLAQPPMEQAKEKLQQNNPEGAGEEQKKAAEALQAAQQELSKAAEALRSQAGEQPQDGAGEMEKALEKSLEQAQQAAKQAAESLQKGEGEQAAKDAAEGAQQLEQSQGRNDPGEAGKPMDDAAEALRKAASQAKAGDAKGAAESLAEAQRALSEAQEKLPQTGKDNPPGTPNPGSNTDPKSAGPRPSGSGGPRTNREGSSAYMGLPPRDRQALEQSQSEPVPPEYAPLVEGYRRSLSSGEVPK